MARLLLLGPAREAAGTRSDVIDAETLADVLREAVDRYGTQFAAVLARSQVWVNGEAVDPLTSVGPHDEVAVLPPVSGGC
jgi:molybdopterin converting factor small subunit